ncbi:replicative DNA helicase [Candidatus Curtissbacteria bacterium]|nr:replicative DNA helicase [Candidatus Curtissbacteria bacterium]
MAQSSAHLPPQDLDAEEAIIGAILLDQDAFTAVVQVLKPEHFYKQSHADIYAAIFDLYEKREPIDLVTLTAQLKAKGMFDKVGGASYLAHLASGVPTASNIAQYARIVRDHYVKRQLISTAARVSQAAFDETGDIRKILDETEQAVFALSQQQMRQNFMPIRDALAESFDRLDELHKKAGGLRGVPTGFWDLDSKLAGMQDSNLLILASRPGQGKCLAYDSKIVNPQTGELLTIEEYFLQKNKSILTLDRDLKLVLSKVSNFVDDGGKEVFLVKTATGREIEVTSSHPFLTVDGWERLEELSVGDRIATPREIPVFGKSDLEDFKVKAIAYFLSDGGLTNSCPRFTNVNPAVVSDFADSMQSFDHILIRKYDSNGKRAPSYEVVKDKYDNENILANFSSKLRLSIRKKGITQLHLAREINVRLESVNLWLNGHAIPSQNNLLLLSNYFNEKVSNNWFPEEFKGFGAKSSVTRFLQELGIMGKSALEKEIPKAVFTLTRGKLALFLNRLFACDGSVYLSPRGPIVSYSSSSKQLIYGVSHLLLRFGIISKIRLKKIKYKGSIRTSFELEIKSCEDIIKFYEEIGILGKEEKLIEVLKVAKKNLLSNNYTKDTIPVEIWNKILLAKGKISWREIYRRLGLPQTHNIHVWKRNPKRSTVLRIARVLDHPNLAKVATADIFWDRIVLIESMGKKQVYDLTIPKTHNFVANDFFVHNTSLATQIAQHVAVREGLPVGIFSLEMSKEELVDRLLVTQSDVDAWKLKTGKLDDSDFDRLQEAMGILADAPLFIDDTPAANILEMRTKARRLQVEHGLSLLIVDYLQLIHGRNLENRVQEVSEISQSLKNLARELKIPVLAVSQLSRAVEQRGTRKPQLADLRESGAIEQDADVVMFLWRPDPDRDEEVLLDIQKHRNGPTGTVDLRFIKERVKFAGVEKRRTKEPAVEEAPLAETA